MYGGQPNITIDTVLSPTEKGYYDQMFSTSSKDFRCTENLMLQGTLKSTLLDKRELAEIWTNYCSSLQPGATGLTPTQFYTLMRAIGLYQHKIPTQQHSSLLLARNFSYLPKFDKVPLPPNPMPSAPTPEVNTASFPVITPAELQTYELTIAQTQTQAPGILSATEARTILMQSGLPKPTMAAIWPLCDRIEPSTGAAKGFLKRNEWILCLHIIAKAKLGVPVPAALPAELVQFLNTYRENHMQQQQGIAGGRAGSMMGADPHSMLRQTPSFAAPPPVQAQPQPTYTSPAPVASVLPSSGYQPSPVAYAAPPQVQAPVQTSAPAAQNTQVYKDLTERVINSIATQAKKFADEVDNLQQTLRRSEDENKQVREELQRELLGLQQDLERNRHLRGELIQTATRAHSDDNPRLFSKLTQVSTFSDMVQKIELALQGLEAIKVDGLSMNEHPQAPLYSQPAGTVFTQPLQTNLQEYGGSIHVTTYDSQFMQTPHSGHQTAPQQEEEEAF